MKYKKIPSDTFKKLQLNAGVLLKNFVPATATVTLTDIVGATTGGTNFTATPTYKDLGEDVDNCPKNTKELKHLDSWDVKISGTYLTVDTALAKLLIGAADISSTDTTKVTPRNDLASTDFSDIWWVGDYSDDNSEASGGFVAIHLLNGLSTGGFQIQTSDNEKGQFAFEISGHYSITAQDTVPFEVYISG